MRRVYIIADDEPITGAIRAAAAIANCPEIAKGIPKGLRDKITEDMLPHAYEEPPSGPKEPTDLELLEARIEAKLEAQETLITALQEADEALSERLDTLEQE